MLVFPTQAQATSTIFFDGFDNLSSWIIYDHWEIVNLYTDGSNPAPSGGTAAQLIAEPVNDYAKMVTVVSTVGYSNINYSFYRKAWSIGEIDCDVFKARWRVLGSNDWIDLEAVATDSPWAYRSWALPPEAWDTEILLGFMVRNQDLLANSTNDYALIDDVLVTGNAIPEPASMILFGMGMLGFGFKSFRRKFGMKKGRGVKKE